MFYRTKDFIINFANKEKEYLALRNSAKVRVKKLPKYEIKSCHFESL